MNKPKATAGKDLSAFKIGIKVKHPKFGDGIVEAIEQMTGSVRLSIRFGNEVKVIDQKWLLRTKYKKIGDRE